jgi:hypothetical protein
LVTLLLSRLLLARLLLLLLLIPTCLIWLISFAAAAAAGTDVDWVAMKGYYLTEGTDAAGV